jgi:CpeT protein
MINQFYDWFEGKFDNKIQAFSYPSKFAYIIVRHKKLSEDGLFYGEQAYFNTLNKPYRQFVMSVTNRIGGNSIIVRNYELQEKQKFCGFRNTDLLFNSRELTYKHGCDTIFTWKSEANQFIGEIEPGCSCAVPWGNKNTYLKNAAALGEDWYHVTDQGFDIDTHEQVWGTKHGQFQFKRSLKHI